MSLSYVMLCYVMLCYLIVSDLILSYLILSYSMQILQYMQLDYEIALKNYYMLMSTYTKWIKACGLQRKAYINVLKLLILGRILPQDVQSLFFSLELQSRQCSEFCGCVSYRVVVG